MVYKLLLISNAFDDDDVSFPNSTKIYDSKVSGQG